MHHFAATNLLECEIPLNDDGGGGDVLGLCQCFGDGEIGHACCDPSVATQARKGSSRSDPDELDWPSNHLNTALSCLRTNVSPLFWSSFDTPY